MSASRFFKKISDSTAIKLFGMFGANSTIVYVGYSEHLKAKKLYNNLSAKGLIDPQLKSHEIKSSDFIGVLGSVRR